VEREIAVGISRGFFGALMTREVLLLAGRVFLLARQMLLDKAVFFFFGDEMAAGALLEEPGGEGEGLGVVAVSEVAGFVFEAEHEIGGDVVIEGGGGELLESFGEIGAEAILGGARQVEGSGEIGDGFGAESDDFFGEPIFARGRAEEFFEETAGANVKNDDTIVFDAFVSESDVAGVEGFDAGLRLDDEEEFFVFFVEMGDNFVDFGLVVVEGDDEISFG
jgi:hypothetical protein